MGFSVEELLEGGVHSQTGEFLVSQIAKVASKRDFTILFEAFVVNPFKQVTPKNYI